MSESEFSLLVTGIIFGLSGGLTPGPLFTFIISETLKYGAREGVKIAFVPILSDLPIVLITIYVISILTEIDIIIGFISLTGAVYLIILAIEGIRFKGKKETPIVPKKPKNMTYEEYKISRKGARKREVKMNTKPSARTHTRRDERSLT